MHFLTLLTLLPLLVASPTPKADPAPAPYNPFYPPGYVAPESPIAERHVISRADLESRAVLQHVGDAAINAARALSQERGYQKGEMRKIRKVVKRRKHGKRATCTVKPTTSTAVSSATSAPVSVSSAASSAATASVSASYIGGGAVVIPTSPSSSAVPASSAVTPSSTSSSAATPSTSSTTLYTVDPAGNGPFSGWGTYFDVGLSACGTYDTPGMPIVAVSAELFDSWPGYDGSNPNNNPICGLHLEISWGGKTALAEVTDRCPGCAVRSLDFSKGLFHEFADYSVGLLGMDSYTGNITWSWVEGTGRLPQVSY